MREELLEKLKSEDKREVREAIEALRDFQDEEVIKAIVEATIRSRSKAVLEAAKATLMSFEKAKDALCREVIRFFEYPEPKLRQTAIDILASHGNVCLSAIKEKLLNHEDYNMRKFGLDILANIGTEEALDLLAELLEDENPNVKMSALEYLRNFSSFKEKVVDHLLRVVPTIEDMYGLTTLASTVIYGNIRDERLIKPLRELLGRFSEPTEKHWIYKMLLFLGDKDSVKEALENAKKAGLERDIQEDMKIFGIEE